jgi:hypothetical protein
MVREYLTAYSRADLDGDNAARRNRWSGQNFPANRPSS